MFKKIGCVARMSANSYFYAENSDFQCFRFVFMLELIKIKVLIRNTPTDSY